MSVDYTLHSLLALWSVILGAVCGLVYEFFRLLHRLHPRAHWLILLEDLSFGLICTAGMMLLFFNLSFGRMRFYAFPGVLLGFVLWYFTLGRAFRQVCLRIFNAVSPPVRYLHRYFRTCGGTFRISLRAEEGFGAKRFIKRSSKNDSSKNRSGG